jgi:putative ABC transport system permease protein
VSADRKQSSEIVGVISDYRPMGVENGTRPTIFWPSLQMPTASIVVRSSLAPQTLSDFLRNTVWAVDRNLPPSEVQPMQHYVDEWLSQRKFNTILLGIFAGLAVVLGMIGIYGILSNLVAARTREIGIRMAIGAAPSEIARLILRQSMLPVLVGLVAGFAASLVLGRFLEALLYNVRPRDPLTLGGAILAILLIAPAAVYVPMRRATRVECTVALRDE